MLDQSSARRTPEEVLEELRTTEAELARRSLHAFVRQAWAVIEPDKQFVDNWHIKVLCWVLESISAGTIIPPLRTLLERAGVDPNTIDLKRVLINVPPGTMKSLLVSVLWPAWEWTRKPHLRYLTFSYGQHLTTRDNLRVRDIVTSVWYQKYFGLDFQEDQNQKTRFDTSAGGWRIASSVGGVGTGEHPDRIIIDDPLTAEQAKSEVERQGVNDWFGNTVSTRGVTRDVTIVIIMQRLHEDDLSGFLTKKGGWFTICWPMRYELTQQNNPSFKPDILDPRTEPGQLLWPALFTEKKVRQLELDLGPYDTAGQLQQRPAPEGGGLFKREWFKYVAAAPVLVRRARGWDTAGTENAGDYTAGARISEECGNVTDPETGDESVAGLGRFFIEDVARQQLGPAGVNALMLDTARADGKGCAQREEKEGGSAGVAVIEARTKAMKGYDYKGVIISGSKITRAKPFRAQVEGGNVYIVRTGDEAKDAWIEPYIRELTTFPTGKHDDQVDASSTAFNAVLLEPPPSGGVLAGEVTW